ncbi:hypothetical protein [Dyadobacter sp. Leaf189]|uniref:hypothetical protein n=1 Tax=Dyadobacter sp. Leaf189 TaxID=1736295 RepID=UPI000701088B|nr:hypothetical protein [Dyadobacter sp. Leaf189]KQS33975.1 hypothetical protein ASG33_08060 [Dyadobacter sp. Leaf189]
MGLKYFSQYTDTDGNNKEVRFIKPDYDGPAIEWKNSYGAVTFVSGSSDSFFSNNFIVTTQAEIGFIFEQRYDLREFVYDRKTFICEVHDLDNNRIEFSGWVEPWDAAHSYQRPPFQVSLTASCGLAHMAKKRYKNLGTTFKKTGLALIQDCLQIIDSDLNLRLSTHMVENSFTEDSRLGLKSFEINTARFYNENGEAMFCAEIANDILQHFNAELIQWDNRWVIRAIVDNSTGLAGDYMDVGDVGLPLAWPTAFFVNGTKSVSLDGGEMRVLPPITKYRVEVDLGTQMPFFENGNMILWNENGLVGWDFTHMDKGNPGWEQFAIVGSETLNALKINGKSPPPYRKKKKKKFGQILLPIVTGMVGALLKRTWLDVEPLQYIESPAGTIGKGDKSVTISFEYETEAFSSDILISIRIPLTVNGKTKQFWVDPSLEPALSGADKSMAGASEQYCLIRVPPLDRGSLTNKGDLNVSGNPNYPAANFSTGSRDQNWTWTVTGVPAGEYRRIGGVTGVLVENGDLIIARVPNGGGTQQQVGGDWEVVSIRNNTKRGTFSIGVALNTLFLSEPFPEEIYVRFYKMADDAGKPGDWYKIFNLNGALEGFIANEEAGRYATTLERGNVTEEEAETINLISGDYNPWYAGSWTKPNSNEITKSWRRRPDLNEGMSIYRAMMKDRLNMTSRPLDVFEGKIKLRPGTLKFSYLHSLIFEDQGNKKFRIVRYAFNDYLREADITAIEVKYEEIPDSELRQDSYIPGSRQLNTVPGQGDGIYPSKEDSTNGRLSAEDLPLTEDELIEKIEAGSRLSALFEGVPPLVFVAGELSTDSVDLSKYLSEAVLYNNENQEEEDQFDFNTLAWETLKKPSWVTAQSIVFLNASVTGKPIYPGSESITFKVGEKPVEPTEEELAEREELEEEAAEQGYTLPPDPPAFYIEVTIPIMVYPKTVVTYQLLDTSGEAPQLVGPLPGVYPVPGKSELRVKINGQHDRYQISIFGGGDTGDNPAITVSEAVFLTNLGTYDMFAESGGRLLPAGNYRAFVTTFIGETIVGRNNIVFTLYDEEFLNLLKFFFTKGGEQLAPISYDGTTKLINPGPANIQTVVDDTQHDKVVIVLDKMPDEAELTRVEHTLNNPATAGSYNLYPNDQEFTPGAYRATVYVYLNGAEVLVRYVHFTVNKKSPVPVGGELKLVQKASAGTSNYKAVATLPETGGLYDLPEPAFNVLSDSVTPEFDWEGHTYEQKRGDKLVLVDSGSTNYPAPIIQSEYYIFGPAGSVAIKGVHVTPSSQRVVVTRKLGGEDGEVVALMKSDFSFGILEDLEDVETGEPGGGMTDYKARDGVGEEVIDYVKYFDVLYDGETIGLNADNELEVIEDGILFKHIQPIGPMSLIGNLTAGTINPYAVLVKDIFEEAEIGDLVTPIAIHNHMVEYVTEQLENSITGTPGYFPIYDTAHTFEDSIVRQIAGKIGIGVNPSEELHVLGDILATGQLMSTIAPGVAPLVVSSSTLVTNLNSDLLDGQHGPYYLDWNNFTNYKLVVAGAGLINGGSLSNNVTLDMGTPSTISNNTTNSTSADSHTHAIATGSLVQGANIVLTGDLADRLVGIGNVTIAATAIPWSIVYNRPTTLEGYGIIDSVKYTDFVNGLNEKENNFSKGDLVAGVGISLTGSLIDRLVGSLDAVISLSTTGVSVGTYRSVSVDAYGRVLGGSNPTTIAGYGLTDVYSIADINNMLIGYVPTTRIITINGVSLDLSQNRTFTISSGVSGTTGYIPVFTSSNSIGNSPIRDTGSEINIADSRSFGVEGPAAMRDYLHVWGYASFGTASNHGSLVIHNTASATAAPSAALEIRSTVKGFLLPRMTYAQRHAIASPEVGLMVFQTNGSASTAVGSYQYFPTGWYPVSYGGTPD